MSSRVLSYTGTRVWPDSMMLSTDFVPRRVELDHVHLGARRHDVRHHGVAQLDHAFDHLAGVFLEQAFAVALADDRADFFFDRIFVGLGAACGRRRDAASASTSPAPTPVA